MTRYVIVNMSANALMHTERVHDMVTLIKFVMTIATARSIMKI